MDNIYSVYPVSIDGVYYNTEGEVTSSNVAALYGSFLQFFYEVNNITGTGTTDEEKRQSIIDQITNRVWYDPLDIDQENPLTAEKMMETMLNRLFALTANGYLDSAAAIPRTYYLTADMAMGLDELVKTLKSAGVQVYSFTNSNGVSQQYTTISETDVFNIVLNWKNIIGSSEAVPKALQYCAGAATSYNRTLQALVELIYVQTGNDLITTQLGDLEKALDTTQKVLQTLNNFQILHNKITADDSQDWETPISGSQDLDTYVSSYETALCSHFGSAIDPVAAQLTDADVAQFRSLYDKLKIYKTELSAQLPTEYAGMTTDQLKETDTLWSKVDKVLVDIEKELALIGSTVPAIDTATTVELTAWDYARMWVNQALITEAELDAAVAKYWVATGWDLQVQGDPVPPLSDTEGHTREQMGVYNFWLCVANYWADQHGGIFPSANVLPAPNDTEFLGRFLNPDPETHPNLEITVPDFPGGNVAGGYSYQVDQNTRYSAAFHCAETNSNWDMWNIDTKTVVEGYKWYLVDIKGWTETQADLAMTQAISEFGRFYGLIGPGVIALPLTYPSSYTGGLGSLELTLRAYFNYHSIMGQTDQNAGYFSETPPDIDDPYMVKGIWHAHWGWVYGDNTDIINYYETDYEWYNFMDFSAQVPLPEKTDAIPLATDSALGVKVAYDVVADTKYALTKWILDYHPESLRTAGESAGSIQQNLTNALTAGQYLNEKTQEEVKRYLFIFEEYYKSASAILNKITQLIEKIAQGISR